MEGVEGLKAWRRRVTRALATAALCAAATVMLGIAAAKAKSDCPRVSPGLTPLDIEGVESGKGFCFSIESSPNALAVVVFDPRRGNQVDFRGFEDAFQTDGDGGPSRRAAYSRFRHQGREVLLLAPSITYPTPFQYNYYEFLMVYGGSGLVSQMVLYYGVPMSENLGRLSFAGTLAGQGWPAAFFNAMGASEREKLFQMMVDVFAVAAKEGASETRLRSLTEARLPSLRRLEPKERAMLTAWFAKNYQDMRNILAMETTHPSDP